MGFVLVAVCLISLTICTHVIQAAPTTSTVQYSNNSTSSPLPISTTGVSVTSSTPTTRTTLPTNTTGDTTTSSVSATNTSSSSTLKPTSTSTPLPITSTPTTSVTSTPVISTSLVPTANSTSPTTKTTSPASTIVTSVSAKITSSPTANTTVSIVTSSSRSQTSAGVSNGTTQAVITDTGSGLQSRDTAIIVLTLVLVASLGINIFIVIRKVRMKCRQPDTKRSYNLSYTPKDDGQVKVTRSETMQSMEYQPGISSGLPEDNEYDVLDASATTIPERRTSKSRVLPPASAKMERPRSSASKVSYADKDFNQRQPERENVNQRPNTIADMQRQAAETYTVPVRRSLDSARPEGNANQHSVGRGSVANVKENSKVTQETGVENRSAPMRPRRKSDRLRRSDIKNVISVDNTQVGVGMSMNEEDDIQLDQPMARDSVDIARLRVRPWKKSKETQVHAAAMVEVDYTENDIEEIMSEDIDDGLYENDDFTEQKTGVDRNVQEQEDDSDPYEDYDYVEKNVKLKRRSSEDKFRQVPDERSKVDFPPISKDTDKTATPLGSYNTADTDQRYTVQRHSGTESDIYENEEFERRFNNQNLEEYPRPIPSVPPPEDDPPPPPSVPPPEDDPPPHPSVPPPEDDPPPPPSVPLPEDDLPPLSTVPPLETYLSQFPRDYPPQHPTEPPPEEEPPPLPTVPPPEDYPPPLPTVSPPDSPLGMTVSSYWTDDQFDIRDPDVVGQDFSEEMSNTYRAEFLQQNSDQLNVIGEEDEEIIQIQLDTSTGNGAHDHDEDDSDVYENEAFQRRHNYKQVTNGAADLQTGYGHIHASVVEEVIVDASYGQSLTQNDITIDYDENDDDTTCENEQFDRDFYAQQNKAHGNVNKDAGSNQRWDNFGASRTNRPDISLNMHEGSNSRPSTNPWESEAYMSPVGEVWPQSPSTEMTPSGFEGDEFNPQTRTVNKAQSRGKFRWSVSDAGSEGGAHGENDLDVWARALESHPVQDFQSSGAESGDEEYDV